MSLRFADVSLLHNGRSVTRPDRNLTKTLLSLFFDYSVYCRWMGIPTRKDQACSRTREWFIWHGLRRRSWRHYSRCPYTQCSCQGVTLISVYETQPFISFFWLSNRSNKLHINLVVVKYPVASVWLHYLTPIRTSFLYLLRLVYVNLFRVWQNFSTAHWDKEDVVAD